MMTKLLLRPLEERDIPLLSGWLNNDHVLRWFENPQDWLAEVEQREGAFSWIHHFIVMQGKMPLGFCQYYDCFDAKEEWYDVAQPGETFSLDYMIGDAQNLGKGLGKQIVALILDAIRRHPSAKRVLAQPDKDNQASAGVLLANGFRYDIEKNYFILQM